MTAFSDAIEWPDWERYSAQPVYNTKAVVQQTGVPAPTLRAWERRYALLSPERAINAYRLYSERDIALIRWLKVRVESGISISHAVELYRHLCEEPPLAPASSIALAHTSSAQTEQPDQSYAAVPFSERDGMEMPAFQ